MSTNSTSSVILLETRCEGCAVPSVRVYHRNSPETWAEGDTPAEAATRLLHLLARDLDHIDGEHHRQVLQGIIADVQAFQDDLESAEARAPAMAGR